MENKPTVKEHFVPKFYLRNFTSKNKKICIYDKIENKMYFKAPQNICYINDLYETKWIDENLENNNYILRNDLENHFSEIEKEFNNTLNNIISKCSCQQNQNKLILTSYEKEIMKKFVANILFRNPWCMKQYNVDSVDENLLENPEICKIQHELGIDVAPLIKSSNKLCLFDDRFDSSLVKKMFDDLDMFDFCILSSETGNFITSSFPILYDLYTDENDLEKFKFIFFPLCPKYAMIYGKDNSELRKNRNRLMTLNLDDSMKFNKMFLETSFEQTRYLLTNNKTNIESILI